MLQGARDVELATVLRELADSLERTDASLDPVADFAEMRCKVVAVDFLLEASCQPLRHQYRCLH